MEHKLVTFIKVKDEDVANDLTQKLSAAGIYFETESEEKFFDPSFTVNTIKNNISIKLYAEDFTKANAVLDEYYKSQISLVPEDYYLFDFTNDELKEILEKADEWGHLDYQLAQVILKNRGETISSETLSVLKEKRKEALSIPEKSQHWMVIAGYFIMASSPFWSDLVRFSGFFISAIIGFILSTAKKTLPDGTSVFMYSATDRKQGKIIIFAAVLLAIVFAVLFIYHN